jgi:FtsP/CotA-like multicopper oxidase with cupredoxin domain
MIGRRQFLALSAVGAAAGVAASCSKSQPAPAGTTSYNVELAAGETDIDLGGITVRTWAYGNQVPGKEIRLRKRQRLHAELTNSLPQGVTVHWHGLAIPNPMDGVPDLTQAAVPTGQRFTYDFVVPDAGTYWGHSHEGTQLDRGLYFPLIIEDPDERVDGTRTHRDQVFAKLRKTGMKPMGPAAPA